MLKQEAIKIFDTDVIDDYCSKVQFGKMKVWEIPNKYRVATKMTLKYGYHWWQHLYLNSVGKCIFARDRGKTVNCGIIKSINVETNTVNIYCKDNPTNYQNYSICYEDLVDRIENNKYKLRKSSAYRVY